MEPAAVTILSLLGQAIRIVVEFANIWEQLAGASENARTFKRLVERVDSDTRYAVGCRDRMIAVFRRHDPSYYDWITGSIESVLEAITHIKQFIEPLGGTGWSASSLQKKIDFINSLEPALIAQERALGYAHASLLASISAMHLLVSQEASTQAASAAMAAAQNSSLSPIRIHSPVLRSPYRSPSERGRRHDIDPAIESTRINTSSPRRVISPEDIDVTSPQTNTS